MANKKLILRGAEFRTVELSVKNTVCTARCDVSCHITESIAEEMGWEIYSNEHLIGGLAGTTPLEGELYIQRIALKISGGTGLDCAAKTADSFKLTRSKDADDDGMVTSLRFRLISDCYEEIVSYFGLMGQAAGQMTITLQPQQETLQPTLGEGADDAEDTEDGDDSGDEPEATPAPKKRVRPKKGAAASTITMEAVR